MGILKMGGRLWSNLFHRPATEQYPFAPREYPEASRGHIEYDETDCILCNICAKRCPTRAIAVDRNARTLSIERMQCIQCGYCAESCPKGCLTMRPGYTAPDSSKTVDTYTVPEREKPKAENRAVSPDMMATVVGHHKSRARPCRPSRGRPKPLDPAGGSQPTGTLFSCPGRRSQTSRRAGIFDPFGIHDLGVPNL